MTEQAATNPVLVLGWDAHAAVPLLTGSGITCRTCADLGALCAAIGEDAESALVTDESLAGVDLGILAHRLALQPSWSALPFIVLTRAGAGRRRTLEMEQLSELLGNVVFMERPLSVLSLVSSVRSTIRSRGRQRQIAVYLAQQIEASAALKTEARFRNMVDSVPALIWMTDLTGQVVFANLHHRYMFGRPVDEIIGEGWTSILLPEDRELYAAAFSSAFAARAPFRTETRMRDKAGQTRWLLCEGVARLDDACCFQGYTSCSVDVTEARLASDELERLAERLRSARDTAQNANLAKSRFLAGMSHELRTPLNGILGYAQLLRIEGGLNEAQSQRVGSMLEAGKHLLEMITLVLALSEIEAGHLELKTVEFDPRTTAAECVDVVRPIASEKGLELTVTVASGTPRAMVTDPTRLRQVLLNLLGNAVKFTARGAVEVRLSPAIRGSVLRIEVADTGPGVTAEQRKRLFQDFGRVDSESTIEGAGLGLALSARLTALMGGRLDYDDNPGGGSVFALELPLTPLTTSAQAVAPSGHEDDAVIGPSVPVLRVLVVDDVAMNRDIAGSFLSAAGHKATCVEGGAEGIAAVEGTDFDVVLMDVRMPGMDGLEATRRIRALTGVRGQVPIVALTAHAFTEQIRECHAAGMDSHLGKPFDPDLLLAVVLQAAATGRQHRLGLGG